MKYIRYKSGSQDIYAFKPGTIRMLSVTFPPDRVTAEDSKLNFSFQ